MTNTSGEINQNIQGKGTTTENYSPLS